MLSHLGNFSSEFHLFRCKRDSLAIADRKIEIFIQSHDIHSNPQPTTVNTLNNLIQCYSNFTSVLEPTCQKKLWCDPFQKEKKNQNFVIHFLI